MNLICSGFHWRKFLIFFLLMLSLTGNVYAQSENLEFGFNWMDSLSVSGEIDTYLFIGNAGDSLYISMIKTGGDLWPGITLYSPGGDQLNSSYDSQRSVISAKLPSSGTYSLMAGDHITGTRTGNYSIFIQRMNKPSKAESIQFGNTIPGSLSFNGEIDTYSFSATSGDSINIMMVKTGGDLWPGITLYSPGGDILNSSYDSQRSVISAKLPASGTYTLLASDYITGARTGNYTIYIQRTSTGGSSESVSTGLPEGAQVTPRPIVSTSKPSDGIPGYQIPTEIQDMKSFIMDNIIIVVLFVFFIIFSIFFLYPYLKRMKLKREMNRNPNDWCYQCKKFTGGAVICPHCGRETMLEIKVEKKSKSETSTPKIETKDIPPNDSQKVNRHDVFISYSSEDKTIADAMCATLESKGIRCWFAPRDVLPGRMYQEEIIKAIEGSQIMVLVFSKHSNNSPHIIRELNSAVSKNVVIIPFRIEDVIPTRAMEYLISVPHWLDAMTPPLETHLEKLVETIQVFLKTSSK